MEKLNVPEWANSQNEKHVKCYNEKIENFKDIMCFIIPAIIVVLVVIF